MKKLIFLIVLSLFAQSSWSKQFTRRLSVNAEGIEGNSDSLLLSPVSLSGDGRYAAFASQAANLVPQDTNQTFDIFVYDIWLKQMVTVSGNSASQSPALAANGRYLAFSSLASNLVPGDTNQAFDIFRYDLQTQQIQRVSNSDDGKASNGDSFNPVLSADGRLVAFESQASNLVAGDDNASSDIFLYDAQTGELTRVSLEGNALAPAISAEGHYVAFAATKQGSSRIFVYASQTRQMQEISMPGDALAATIAGDGRYIAFDSVGTNLVSAVWVHDLILQETLPVTPNLDNHALLPTISENGRYVVFASYATQLVPDDTNGVVDLFRYDRETGQILRVNVNSQAQESNFGAFPTAAAMSMDGCTVIFDSSATNLVNDDTNDSFDVFVHQVVTQPVTFKVATGIVDLPTVAVRGWGMYRVQLRFDDKWVVAKMIPLPSSFPNESCSYFSVDSGLLYLPWVEVTQAGQVMSYEVVLAKVSSAWQFEVARATRWED